MPFHKIVRNSLILALTALLIFLTQSAIADYYEYDYFYTTDRMSREHRSAGDVDDWIERGNSTVTASPVFADGIRLTAWASGADETAYEFGIASAVYFFEIPRGAQSIEIKVRYKGEPHEGYLDDYGKVAGRIWARNLEKEREYPDRGEDTETLYGDSFILRANRYSETIKIPAVNHVDDGLLELHIVAQNGELVDLNYIDVMTYRRQPKTRVVQYTEAYDWDPWYNYTYTYFYAGPHYYLTNYGYYVRWSYPIYDRHYVTIRRNYRRYLDRYRRRHGVAVHHYYRPVRDVKIHVYNRDRDSARTRKHLTKWTESYEKVRHEYSQTRYTKKRRDRTNLESIQTRIRQTIEKHRRNPALVDREIQTRRISLKRRRDRTTNESQRQSIKTQINSRQQTDNSERYERIKRLRAQQQKDSSRTINRYRKTAPRNERETKTEDRRSSRVKRRRTDTTETKKASNRKKRRDDDDDDDEDEDEDERSKRRKRRKKRR